MYIKLNIQFVEVFLRVNIHIYMIESKCRMERIRAIQLVLRCY